jgi:hypothetical protein
MDAKKTFPFSNGTRAVQNRKRFPNKTSTGAGLAPAALASSAISRTYVHQGKGTAIAVDLKGVCMDVTISIRMIGRRFAIASELLGSLWNNKRWWIVPMVVVLLGFVVVLVMAQSSAIAPFIYTLF